jgi:hypothetical protein
MALFKVKGDLGGIGHHLIAINQNRHLTLARQAEQGDLAQAGHHLDQIGVQALDRQDQAHLFAEGGMAELVELHLEAGPLKGKIPTGAF